MRMHLRVQPRAQRELADGPVPHVLDAASLCKDQSSCGVVLLPTLHKVTKAREA